MSSSSDYETTLLVVREVQVYRVPPRTTARGYRASDWDVTAHLWSGRLKVVAVGEECVIKLEDIASGQLFAQSKYTPENGSVEPVLDSSRYFVVKIEDAASGRHAFVGLGFQERTDAFDFNVALQDHAKHGRLRKEAAAMQASGATNGPSQSQSDYSLKPGATISVQLGGLAKKKTESPMVQTGTPFGLPPPPSANTASHASTSSGSSTTPAPTGWIQF